MFHSKKFTDENHKLLNIRRTIESYETRFFKSANHIKAAYNGVEDDDIPMTILEVLDEKLIEKKDEVNRGTMKGYRSALNLFKKWMKAAHLVNFGVHRNHPYKMTNRITKIFYKWMLDKKIGSKTSKKRYDSAIKDSTASGYISRLGALYEMFYIENNNDIDGIIVNPFRNVRKPKKRYEERQQALERELDWK